ncbi:MAG: tryptophan synthase subunit beta [Candidatus Eremiobacterota bacterium]
MKDTKQWYFGSYGGRFVPDSLMEPLEEISEAYETCKFDPAFRKELTDLYHNYSGRPTPLYFAEVSSRILGAGRIYLKREDLNHTGAHKINNTLGQILLAKRMGKKRIIAETGAGQHGVATATVAARFGMECVIYMGAEDIERQKMNVFRMKLLGAEVKSVKSGGKGLKDAVDEAIMDLVEHVESTYYLIGSAVGPHPYPLMVRDFQSIIGQEVREQLMKAGENLPDYIVACVGGGSNAMGIFHEFIQDETVKLIGAEGGGTSMEPGCHAATLSLGKPGILHGSRSYLLSDSDGQVLESYSISAGLDYPGIGPEHSYLKDTGRVSYRSVSDREALNAFRFLSEKEGIIPALESSHAIAEGMKIAETMKENEIMVINLSGRGDKDIYTVAEHIGMNI